MNFKNTSKSKNNMPFFKTTTLFFPSTNSNAESFFKTAMEEQSNGKHHDASNRSTKVSKRLRNDTSAEAPAEQVPCTSISNLEKNQFFF